MEDLRQLYEAAVSRSKELEAENADLSASVARLDVDRLKDEFLAMVSHELRTRSRSSWAWPRPWSGGPTWPPPPTARRFCSGSSARANVCATWSSSCSRPARSWPTTARCCGPRRSWPPRWWPRWSTPGGWPSPTAASSCACPTGPASSQGDAEALRMVVGNLVDNAGKHAPPGTPIQVTVDQPEGLTQIQVTDGGEGVAEIDRERIFAPFTQLDASTTRRVGGVGLGLFLVDRLVRGMGGKVWVGGRPRRRGPFRGRAARPGPGIGSPLPRREPPERSRRPNRYEARQLPRGPGRPAAGRTAGRRLRRAR